MYLWTCVTMAIDRRLPLQDRGRLHWNFYWSRIRYAVRRIVLLLASLGQQTCDKIEGILINSKVKLKLLTQVETFSM